MLNKEERQAAKGRQRLFAI